MTSLTVHAPDGVPEVVEGTDLAAALLGALGHGTGGHDLVDGDVVVVTSKVVSKSEGRVRRGDRARALADESGALLWLDEGQTGMGRTGEWFGYQNFGVKPDIVTMAKGVASGYAAISCTVTTERVFDMFKDDASDPLNYFRDISTFGGCTSGPVAALENMRIIEDENLLANTDAMGARMMDNLHALMDKHRVIGDVRGKGLFCGVELVSDRTTKEVVTEAQVAAVVAECGARGVIIGASNRSVPDKNNCLCFSPALISTADDIDQITDAVDGALTKVFG